MTPERYLRNVGVTFEAACRLTLWLTVGLVCLALGGCGPTHRAAHSHLGVNDPPLLVPWTRVGDITLGGLRSDIEQEYGSLKHGYYLLHGGELAVTFYGDRVGRIGFGTPYYRTNRGFGVGSTIPLGPCHRTATNPCEHRWHGFIYNPTLREDPCSCWVKVGTKPQSLPFQFDKPWFFIYLRHGRVSGFYFDLKYID
jgi:hypothetical protein